MGRILIKIVCSKKGFSFHSIVLNLAEDGLGPVKDGVIEVTHFELLIFLVSFPRSVLEVFVLPFLEFDIPFEYYHASSEGISA